MESLQKLILFIEDSTNRKLSFKKFRQFSSNFIKNKNIRQTLFNTEKFCALCFSSEKLEIDHIISVKKCFDNKDYLLCNSIKNLQVLCKKCNTSKLP